MQDPEEEPVDAEVVGEDQSQELVQQTTPGTLFQTDDPAQVLARASEVAAGLKDVITKQGLVTRIGGGEHVQVEGWQTVGSMLGVFAVESGTRELPTPDGQKSPKGPWGYESRYEARTRDGAVVGAGVARCTRSEKTWSSRDDYALESMAQTRATSKALKAPLGWIVALAGYKTTPSEEMPKESSEKHAASEQLEDRLSAALGVLGLDSTGSVRVMAAMEKDSGEDYLPRISARAVCHVAAMLAQNNKPEEGENAGGSTGSNDEQRDAGGDPSDEQGV